MAEKLTEQQRQAVENRGGKLLVSAAAGSGKTKVLVDRLMGYILDPVAPANIDDFLIITYTKAAASELRGKIAAKMSEHLADQPENRHLQRQMQRIYMAKISTVHAYCTDLLREFAFELSIGGDFRVGDESECGVLMEQAMNAVLEQAYETGMEDPDFRAFVDNQGLGRDDRLVPLIVSQVYGSARCHLDPEGWLNRCAGEMELPEGTDPAETVWGAYLLTDLKTWLAGQIRAMEACVEMAWEQGLDKPATVLSSEVVGLRHLWESETWDQVVQRRNVEFGRLTFPRKYDDEETKARIKSVRDACKKGLERKLKAFSDPAETVMEDLGSTAASMRGLIGLVQAFSRSYEKLKHQRRVLDFSDLEHRTLDLLLGKSRTGPTRIAREVGRRFREVLVDEYQDTNAVQDAIFSALTEEGNNCFMVGDVKQSIYRFRLADPGIFLDKYERYAHADEANAGGGRKVLLSRNFRSGGAVLAAANDVFRLCMSKAVGDLDYTDSEALVEGIPHTPLGEPETELHVISTQEDAYGQEAEFVARRIAELLDGTHFVRDKDALRPIRPEDIVILLRSPGSVGRDYLQALSARKIRCVMMGGRDLLGTGEISVLRAILQVISNPRQDIPLLCALASPVFGFTADDLAALRAGRKDLELYDALTRFDYPKADHFLSTLTYLRSRAGMVGLAKLLEEIFLTTRMDSIYAAMADGVERSANLRAFFNIAVEFESASGGNLDQFLEHLDALEESGLRLQDAASGSAVTIMSIHKSKGLEFPVVFLSGLSRSFNREDLRAQVLCDRDLGLGFSAVDRVNRVRYPTLAKRAIAVKTAAESLSEELRVLYVAMTRARDRLIMTYAAKTPERELEQMGSRLDLVGPKFLAGQVTCPGEWVLMAAMNRAEAGALFSLAGTRPAETVLGEYPWLIETHEGLDSLGASEKEADEISFPEDGLQRLKDGLDYSYPHGPATRAPSKQTATQLKGRDKDQEAAEQVRPEPAPRAFLRPSFGKKPLADGRAYGNAMHAFLQYVDFSRCESSDEIQAQVGELTERGLLEQEMSEHIDCGAIAAFFATDLGRKLKTGKVLREFKFSILDDGEGYGEGLTGEQVLLQGVVDCALIEQDGVTVLDFKTDRVTSETLSAAAERYRTQVQAYARAMERICEKPVKKKLLWFFRLNRAVEL